MESRLEPCVWMPGVGGMDVLELRSVSAAPCGPLKEVTVLSSDYSSSHNAGDRCGRMCCLA